MTSYQAPFPLFVHAWFRSGSTYIWSKLRDNEKLICYYEPFHEVLGEKTLVEQIERHKPIETSLNLRHPVQQRHYFNEYKKLLMKDQLNFVSELPYTNYFLLPNQEDIPRYKYIQTLISHAFNEDRLPVLSFCRSQMRSAWIKQNFLGTHIAQIRDPLSQYESFTVQPYFRNTMIKIALDLRRNNPACFTHIVHFDRFAASFEKRPDLPAEQLYEYFLKPDDFFAIFLVIWTLSVLQSMSCSDLTLDIDSLASDISYRSQVRDWFAALGCFLDFSDCSTPLTTNFDTEKAARMITEAGRAFRENACTVLVYDPLKIAIGLKCVSDRSRKAIDQFLN
jgi:hypothetical protein